MTTNQTIDGVPRELLKTLLMILEEKAPYSHLPKYEWAEKLRALLDAPAVSLTDEGEKPAAQPQGEPVAELQVAFFEHGPMATINWFTPSAFEPGLTKLYAEQPAPVALPSSAATPRLVVTSDKSPRYERIAVPQSMCEACGDSKQIILARDDEGVSMGPCPHCRPKPPPAGSDRVSMEGAMIFCGGAPNPITYTGNGAIVNLDGYVLYAPGAEPVAVVMPDLWQPIETAPKDGTEIILRKGDRVTSGAWTEWSKAEAEFHGSTGAYLGQVEYDSGSLWASWDGGFCDDDHPTHWQPLPTVTPQQ